MSGMKVNRENCNKQRIINDSPTFLLCREALISYFFPLSRTLVNLSQCQGLFGIIYTVENFQSALNFY